jgi:Vitamin K-dependent gamma-carboxylase
MTLDQTIRLTEVCMGLAFCQQSIEHLFAARYERTLHAMRLVLAILLVIGLQTTGMLAGLLLIGVLLLRLYDGPYNGGSDRMSLLMLCCLCLAHWLPTERGRELIIGYLALQLVLSYCMAGLVKILNPHWRTGRALMDVFLFSAYPRSESLRRFSDSPRLLLPMSWAVMLLELLFPLSLLNRTALCIALLLTAAFHLVNALLFGLNRFFWIWLAAYPSLLWLQQRLMTGH